MMSQVPLFFASFEMQLVCISYSKMLVLTFIVHRECIQGRHGSIEASSSASISVEPQIAVRPYMWIRDKIIKHKPYFIFATRETVDSYS